MKDENTIKFFVDNQKKEIIKISKGEFYFRGKKVKDIHKVYERFNDWLKLTENPNLKERR
jgi:hypothetical protein